MGSNMDGFLRAGYPTVERDPPPPIPLYLRVKPLPPTGPLLPPVGQSSKFQIPPQTWHVDTKARAGAGRERAGRGGAGGAGRGPAGAEGGGSSPRPRPVFTEGGVSAVPAPSRPAPRSGADPAASAADRPRASPSWKWEPTRSATT